MKLPKIDQKGFTHILGLLLCAAVFGAIGAYVLKASHAAGVQSESYWADSTKIYYATGALQPPANKQKATSLSSTVIAAARRLPASVDLTKWAAPVKNQGPLSSCAAWAVDYNLFGWYVAKYQYKGGMHAPLYTYDQIVNSRNIGTYTEDHLKIATYQGLDTVADYKYPYHNYHYLPSPKEQINASKYRIKWYFNIYLGVQPGNTAETLLKQQLASGSPAVMGIPVYKEFAYANSKKSLVGLPSATHDKLFGYHEVTALGYNSKGVIIENSWGKKWGDKGFGTLSWDLVNNYSDEAYAITGINVKV